MNIRKPTDYTAMFTTLDKLMAAQLPQMELYCEIGRVVSGRAAKKEWLSRRRNTCKRPIPRPMAFLPATCTGCVTSTGCTATRRNCWRRQCV